MRYLKQFLCTMLVALGVAVALASPAEATHGRYGTISWKKLGPPAAANAIEITLTTGWRRNFFTPLPNLGSIINAGTLSVKTSGGSVIANFSGNDEVIFVDAANNWILCRRVVTYTIPNAALTYTLSYENCCRISTLEGGNNDLNFYLRSMVNLSLEDNSPVSAMPPIVYLQRGGVRTFYVPGIDADAGNTLRWILAPTGSAALVGSGLNQQSPTFGGQVLSIDPSTGLATWNVLGTQTVGDLWAVQFIIEERSPGNVLLNSIPVDFLIEIEEEDPNTVPPVVVPGSPVCGGTLPVIAGSNISFTIGFSDSDIGDVVTLSSGGVPPGATMTPTLPVSGNPVSSTFSWTPSLGQIGSYLVQFVGTDQGNNQTFCNYTISVTGQPPDCDAGGPYSATCICANDCATIQLDGSGSSDPDGGALTYAWSGPGIVFDNASSVTPTACFPVGTTTVTLVVTDNQSLSSTCTVDVIVDDDNTPPTISCPAGFAVECEADVPACNPADASASDNCGTVTVTCADGPLVGGGCGGTIIRTYTATDACGNTASCTQVITVDDNTPPTISCPAGFAVECEADVPVCNPADASASDNCGTVTVTCADGPLVGGGCGGTIIRTYTATDACGNSATCTQVITVDDNTPPTISCPAGFAVECLADVPACNPADASASDNCGAVTLTCADGPLVGGGCGGTIIRTYMATDDCGNSATCTQVITVDDNTPPTISCPAGFAVECEADVPVCNPADASASDNCGAVTVTCADGPLVGGGCGGTIIRTYTATDACGNTASCTLVITVDDNTPPSISCPAGFAVECEADVPACNPADASASDNCGTVTVTCADGPLVGGGCGGTIIRTYTATDACGNSATCTQVITVDDNTPPTISCPAGFAVECEADVPVCNPADASASDNCGTVTVTCADGPLAGGGCGGTIIRTYTATDACGNSATCTQVITVDDNTPPTISCPAGFAVECEADVPACNPADASASDNCGAVTLTCADGPLVGGGCGGTIIRTYTATDACGNTAFCTQVITVDDNTPPSISCPAGFAVECLADVPVCNPADASASDNCGTVTVTCADGPLVGGGCGGTIIRTYTATDACGNSATCTQVITVDDNTPPTIVCPGDLTVECGSPTDPSATGEPAVEDNCDLAPAVSHADAITPGNCLQEFTITRTWVAIDVCNNAATCVQVITVDDSEGPEMTCPPDVTIECSASTDPANTGTASGVDACDPNPAAVTYSDVVTPGVCGGSSEITRTWTGTDACGNPSSCIQTITIVDNTPPTITACPPNITVDGLANLPACGIGEFDAEDLCGDVTLTCSRNGLGGVGCSNAPVNVVYTYTATDECGNSASCTRIVSVILPACNFFVSAASSSGQELEVVSGSQITVPLSLDTVADELSRVNLAFGYNPSALTLLKVTPGEAVGQWDEFTYEIVPGVDENYRVVSVSMSTDAQAGESVPAGLFSPHGVVANMHFLMAGDRGLEGSVQMITPEQATCDNNCLTSRDGSRSYVRSDIASAPCAAVSGVALSSVVMTSGRVRILAPVERTGDVNLNGVANEVGDAVLFVEYLTYDDVVLSPDPAHRAMQIAATDVNGDGVTATVADLIYLIRVVTGDIPAGGIAKLSPSAGAASVDLRTDNGSVSVSVTSSTPVGGALLVFRVNGSSMGQPQLSPAASAMNMRASGSDGRVKILIYGWDASAHLNSGTNELLSMALSGMEKLELESVELSDERGALLQVSAAKSTVPTEYALGQNYPNPFNAGTVIPVQLSNAGSWNMTIHNVMGQVVRQFDGVDAAGTVLVPWDGRNDDGLAVPSGIYFYRVSLPTGQSMTRKMTLLK